MSKRIPNEYWVAWKEKFFSLFVSGKIILYFVTFGATTVLLIYGFITEKAWSNVIITAITVIAGFRGIVQIANLRRDNHNNGHNDNGNDTQGLDFRRLFDMVRPKKNGGTEHDLADMDKS